MKVDGLKNLDKPGDNSRKVGHELLSVLKKQDIELLLTMLNNVNIKGDMAEQLVRIKGGLATVAPLFTE